MRVLALGFCIFGVLLLSPASTQAKDDSYNKRVGRFNKAIKSRDPKARSQAFDYLRGLSNPKVVEEFIKGVRLLESSNKRIAAEQKKNGEVYTKAINDLQRAHELFQSTQQNARETAAYNKKDRKISKVRDKAVRTIKKLENDVSRNRALMQTAIIALSECLAAMGDEDLGGSLGVLQAKWLESKHLPDRLRFIAAITELKKPVITDALNAIVSAEDQPTVVRLAAINALSAREDGTLYGKALEMLKLPTDQQPFLVAAIGVLRRMHDRRSIAPLIEFLDRKDIKRTRSDAYRALLSLTGQNHGRYAGEWRKWWAEAKGDFVMPKAAMPTGNVMQPDQGGTFYGIPLTSDRILYIVDISGSMDRMQKGGRSSGQTKWEVLKQELISSVMTLNPTDTFNVIFFNHEIIQWQARKVEASERNKKMLKKWVDEQKPVGGTNISDALHKGFSIAAAVDGRPALDTIFFLTDGKPTAGRIWDPKKILEIHREWNQTAKLTVHAIGVGGGHDVEFLKELARIGDGRYVSTLPVPDIEVDALALDFGEQEIGKPESRMLVISNSGHGVCTVEDLTLKLGKHFRMVSVSKEKPWSIEKGEVLQVKLEFVGKKAEAVQDQLVITSNDKSTPELSVRLFAKGK